MLYRASMFSCGHPPPEVKQKVKFPNWNSNWAVGFPASPQKLLWPSFGCKLTNSHWALSLQRLTDRCQVGLDSLLAVAPEYRTTTGELWRLVRSTLSSSLKFTTDCTFSKEKLLKLSIIVAVGKENCELQSIIT